MCPPSGIDSNAARSVPALSVTEQTTIASCVPADSMSQAAYAHAKQYLRHDILAHSIRVFLLAKHLAEKTEAFAPWSQSEHRLALLFTACILHDVGTCKHYNTAPVRFEIEGADAARSFLASYNAVSSAEQQEVWNAIALHSTPQISERMPGLVGLVRLAVMADFKRPTALALIDDDFVVKMEQSFPRGSIEKVLGDAVVDQALQCENPRLKAPSASWPGELLRAKLAEPDHDGVNKGF